MSRDDALDWARKVREGRDRLRAELAGGELDLSGVLDRAASDPILGQVRLGYALESLPGARKVDTRRRLTELGLDPTTLLGALDGSAADVVRAEFGGAPAGEAPEQDPEPTEGVADTVPPLPEGSSVIVIAGPGGVGKGTLVSLLLQRDDRLWLSRSWTTRARRPGESVDAYRFATEEEFRAHERRGGFLEWTRFLDYFQGSPVPEPEPGHDVVFEIDVRGAANVKRLYPEALLIFLDAPSREVQEQRLRGRGDDEHRVRQRLEKAAEEVEAARGMDFVHVVNDDLDRAVTELTSLIETHRAR